MSPFSKRLQFCFIPIILGLFIWGVWPTLSEMAEVWSNRQQYSHGFLVPLFSIYLLWRRRDFIHGFSIQPNLGGVCLVAAGAALHWAGGYFYYDWLSGLALLPTLAGIVLSLAGWQALRWSWPAVAFLIFMLPLPFRIEHALSFPLQLFATRASTYCLQTLGFPAVAEGNIILLEGSRIGVVEACNGLGMLISFFALTTAVTLVIERHWLIKILIVLSAVPIALLANVVRITATGILAETVGMEVADQVFHGPAGWFIMPLLALGLLWVEMKLLSLLLIEVPDNSSEAFDLSELERPGKDSPGKNKTERKSSSVPVG